MHAVSQRIRHLVGCHSYMAVHPQVYHGSVLALEGIHIIQLEASVTTRLGRARLKPPMATDPASSQARYCSFTIVLPIG